MPGDAEAATHGDEAASLQLVKETEVDTADFKFRQYNLGVLSHYSYLLGSGGEAMIVDPARDVSRYVKDAEALKLKITSVYLTHSHADFVAGHMELAKATGAILIMNGGSGALFPHSKVKDGDAIRFGTVRCVVAETPGHTPDGTCLYVFSPAGRASPNFVLTGDTLFIGSVGRPDLMGDGMPAARLAAMGFKSWMEKLALLPDETKIFPAHGAGSLCGAHLSDKPVSTIGEQKRENVYLQHRSLHSYVTAVLTGLPEAPQYFSHNAKMNHDGPALVDWERPGVPGLAPQDARKKLGEGAWLVDVRDAKLFAAEHPEGAVNIGIRGRFETWVGTMVPWGAPLILAGAEDEVKEAAFRLHRVGYDMPAGWLQGGVEAWKQAGLPVKSVAMVRPADLFAQMKAGSMPIIVDVRLPAEWASLRIGDVLNIPLTKLASEGRRLDPGLPVLAVCNSAYRSIMAAGILQNMGLQDVRNLEGGSEAWVAAGLPTQGAACPAPVAQPASGGAMVVPESVGAEELKTRLLDVPGSLDVVDIRPGWQFAEFSIDGSTSVPLDKVLNSPLLLSGSAPLVLVCRDGSISAAVAGVLAQRTARPVRFLAGGVQRYYDEAMRPAGIIGDRIGGGGPAAQGPAQPPAAKPAAAAPEVPASPAPVAPPRRSAGC